MVSRHINPALQPNSSDGSDGFKFKAAKNEKTHGENWETRGSGRQVEKKLRDPIWETTARQVEDNWKTIGRQLEDNCDTTSGRQRGDKWKTLGRLHLGDN